MVLPEQRKGPTLRQVADEAGVSITTASFVLSGRKDGKPPPAAATASKVIIAAQKLGYIPNAHAQAMRTGRTRTLALALGDTRDPWAGELAHQVTLAAQRHGLSTLVIADESWPTLLTSHRFDAALVTGADASAATRATVASLAAQGLPMVVFSVILEPEGYDLICSDPSPAVVLAYHRLAARHQQVHFLAADGPAIEPPVRSRQQVFLDAVTASGRPTDHLVRLVPPTMGQARLSAIDWLRSPDRPRAVVAQNGFVAMGLQAAAVEVGLRTPDDLEIIALGDVPSSGALFAPISLYGYSEVFETVAQTLVTRALRPQSPATRQDLVWTFHSGATTID